nr:MAG TPA: hypothetical protein [Caudoviricetes sp.]
MLWLFKNPFNLPLYCKHQKRHIKLYAFVIKSPYIQSSLECFLVFYGILWYFTVFLYF